MTDLGRLDGPLMVFGGPYSNLRAAEALRAESRRLGIPPERCICTGDLAAYCAEPVETIDLIRDWACPLVRGNCEESLARGEDQCGCGFEKGTACDLLSRQWFAYASARVDDERREWMGARPRQIRFQLGGLTAAVVHGAVDEVSRFIFASTPETHKRAQADLAGTQVVLAGHSGLPFSHRLADGRLWHNAGVIGMPANDGTPSVWYSLLTPDGASIRFEHRRLHYDHGGAARAMRAAGLAEGYARALETGLWPSLDVLPGRERVAAGRPLAPPPCVISPDPGPT